MVQKIAASSTSLPVLEPAHCRIPERVPACNDYRPTLGHFFASLGELAHFPRTVEEPVFRELRYEPLLSDELRRVSVVCQYFSSYVGILLPTQAMQGMASLFDEAAPRRKRRGGDTSSTKEAAATRNEVKKSRDQGS